MKFTLRRSIIAATACLTYGGIATAGQLNMQVTGLTSDKGQVICRIFDNADDFPRGVAFRSVFAPISDGQADCAFGDVPTGDYALAAAHDANANSKVDTNFLGLPREGFGFSRDAKPSFGPPSYDEVVFSVDGKGAVLRLTMQYR